LQIFLKDGVFSPSFLLYNGESNIELKWVKRSMPIVPLSLIKNGDRLQEDAVTKLGNVLLPKGKLLHQKELEILSAFLVASVAIESREGLEETDQAGSNGSLPYEEQFMLYKQYDKMIQLLKKTFAYSNSGENLPILEVRTTLESLLAYIHQYSILSFSPKIAIPSDYLYHNSLLVAMTSYQLAKWQGVASKDLIPIALAGLFHDIGNMKIDMNILDKPGKLMAHELEEVRRHTLYGYQILKNVPAINEGVKLTALQHHERFDGSGYPLGLTADKIHPYAKIIAVADIYHAMTSARMHRKAESAYLVLEQLNKESFGKLDPELVQIFIQKVTALHNGILVRLNDNRIGEIIFTDRNNPTRPMVNINGVIVNLTIERNYFIQEVVRK
jgi:HD-GYP domain-containing protein (c-di-GMP phosphodiesterase class II)